MKKHWILYIVVFAISLSISKSDATNPAYKIISSGSVTCLLIEKDLLYAANDAGHIEVFNWKTKKRLETIELQKISDFTGTKVAAKIICIDKLPEMAKILLVSQASNGFRNVSISNGGKIETIVSAEVEKLMVKKAIFISNTEILMATLANELILYNMDSRKMVYKKQLSSSVFSDFDLNDDKTRAAITDESGIIRIIDSKSGNKIKEYKEMNLDNIYQVHYNNSKIIGAGQDRRVSVYSTKPGESGYYLESDFIVYCVGLSDDGSFGAYSSSEENDITVFNTATKDKVAVLSGQKSTLTQIKFAQNNFIISASEDQEILVWKWK
jgi:hypothetical protein